MLPAPSCTPPLASSTPLHPDHQIPIFGPASADSHMLGMIYSPLIRQVTPKAAHDIRSQQLTRFQEKWQVGAKSIPFLGTLPTGDSNPRSLHLCKDEGHHWACPWASCSSSQYCTTSTTSLFKRRMNYWWCSGALSNRIVGQQEHSVVQMHQNA